MPTQSGPARGSHSLSYLFVFLGCAALILTLSGNYLSGQRTAFTDTGQYWQGGITLLIDAMFAALCWKIGRDAARRFYGQACAWGAVAALFGAVSAWSLIGFSLSEQLNKARTAEINTQRQLEVARVNYEARRESWDSYQSNLAQIAALTKDAKERSAVLAESEKAAKSVPQMEAPEIKVALTDPKAQVMAELAKRANFTVNEADFQLGYSIMIAVLAVLAKALCFGIAGHAKPEDPPLAAAAAPETVPELAIAPRKVAWKGFPDYTQRGLLDAVGTVTLKDAEGIVARFLREETLQVPDAQTNAADMHQHFVFWAQRVGERCLSANLFGRSLTKLGVERRKAKGGAKNFYVGIAIRGKATAKLNGHGSNVATLPLSHGRLVA